MKDVTYQKFVKRWQEVIDVPVQDVGPFTPLYKAMVKRLKVMPLPWLIVVGLIVVVCLYGVVGTSLVSFVSLLQRGF